MKINARGFMVISNADVLSAVTPSVSVAKKTTIPLQSGSKYISVKLLNGDSIYLVANVKCYINDIFRCVCAHLVLGNRQIFGLAYLLNGEYTFFSSNDKLWKCPTVPKNWARTPGWGTDLLDNPYVIFYLRVHTYVDCVAYLKCSNSLNLYYWQLRKNVRQRWRAGTAREERCFELAALALQADVGDYDPSNHAHGSYFVVDDYFPPWIITLRGTNFLTRHLPKTHADLRGMSSDEARAQYCREASRPPYALNSHQFSLRKNRNDSQCSVQLFVAPRGLEFLELTPNGDTFKRITMPWFKIGKVAFDRRKFSVSSVDNPHLKQTFFTTSDETSRDLLNFCRSFHQNLIGLQRELNQARRLESQSQRQFRESYIYSDSEDLVFSQHIDRLQYLSDNPANNQPTTTAGPRISLISQTSSNTTSGIVSDKQQNQDSENDTDTGFESNGSGAVACKVADTTLKSLDDSKRLVDEKSVASIAELSVGASSTHNISRQSGIVESTSDTTIRLIGEDCQSICTISTTEKADSSFFDKKDCERPLSTNCHVSPSNANLTSRHQTESPDTISGCCQVSGSISGSIDMVTSSTQTTPLTSCSEYYSGLEHRPCSSVILLVNNEVTEDNCEDISTNEQPRSPSHSSYLSPAGTVVERSLNDSHDSTFFATPVAPSSKKPQSQDVQNVSNASDFDYSNCATSNSDNSKRCPTVIGADQYEATLSFPSTSPSAIMQAISEPKLAAPWNVHGSVNDGSRCYRRIKAECLLDNLSPLSINDQLHNQISRNFIPPADYRFCPCCETCHCSDVYSNSNDKLTKHKRLEHERTLYESRHVVNNKESTFTSNFFGNHPLKQALSYENASSSRCHVNLHRPAIASTQVYCNTEFQTTSPHHCSCNNAHLLFNSPNRFYKPTGGITYKSSLPGNSSSNTVVIGRVQSSPRDGPVAAYRQRAALRREARRVQAAIFNSALESTDLQQNYMCRSCGESHLPSESLDVRQLNHFISSRAAHMDLPMIKALCDDRSLQDVRSCDRKSTSSNVAHQPRMLTSGSSHPVLTLTSSSSVSRRSAYPGGDQRPQSWHESNILLKTNCGGGEAACDSYVETNQALNLNHETDANALSLQKSQYESSATAPRFASTPNLSDQSRLEISLPPPPPYDPLARRISDLNLCEVIDGFVNTLEQRSCDEYDCSQLCRLDRGGFADGNHYPSPACNSRKPQTFGFLPDNHVYSVR